jgi:hypothetical protein
MCSRTGYTEGHAGGGLERHSREVGKVGKYGLHVCCCYLCTNAGQGHGSHAFPPTNQEWRGLVGI